MLAASVLSILASCHRSGVAVACAFQKTQPSRLVWPFLGARDVPRNVRLYVAYVFDPAETRAPMNPPSLRQVGGDRIAVTVSNEPAEVRPYGQRFYLKPQAPLLPNTSYELVDGWTLEDCPADAGVCEEESPQPFSTFTTGDNIDVMPPVFTSRKVDSRSNREVCNDSACCGPYDLALTNLTWSAANDQSAVGYRVYNKGKVIEPLTTLAELRVQTRCKEMSYQPSSLGRLAEFGAIEIRAVDLAGNETAVPALGSINDGVCSKGGCMFGGTRTSPGAGSGTLAFLAAVGGVVMRRQCGGRRVVV